MNVTVSSRTSSLDDAAREDISSRVYFALSRFSPRIEQVTVQVGDVGTLRVSSQQLCRLSVRMERLGSFSVESVEHETPDAVTRAANRAARQMERILDRQRDKAQRASKEEVSGSTRLDDEEKKAAITRQHAKGNDNAKAC